MIHILKILLFSILTLVNIYCLVANLYVLGFVSKYISQRIKAFAVWFIIIEAVALYSYMLWNN